MEENHEKIDPMLGVCISQIEKYFGECAELIIKHAVIGSIKTAIVTFEGMADKQALSELVYKPLCICGEEGVDSGKALLEKLVGILPLAEDQKKVTAIEEAALAIMSGFAAVFADGAGFAVVTGVQGYATRSVTEPSTQINLRGSRESFNEAVRTNIAMVRRRMKSPDLKTEMVKLGKMSSTDACIFYMESKADKQLLNAVKKRISDYPLDIVLDSEYLECFLENDDNGLFSGITATERPDVFLSKLYEGRIGVIVDGTPFSLVLPCVFSENFNMLDDYSHKPFFSAFLRSLRLLAYLISVFLPGIYVTLCNFSPEMFSDRLLLNISSSAQGTAFPIMLECLIMYLLYEIMREAGLRLPKSVGHTVSIVGGLVIGEITVSAGLMSAPTVLVIAAAGLAAFAVPDLYDGSMILRPAFIIAGGFFGLFGFALSICCFMFSLCSRETFCVAYTAPFAPLDRKSILRDTFVRRSWKKLSGTEMNISKLGKPTADKGSKNEKNKS